MAKKLTTRILFRLLRQFAPVLSDKIYLQLFYYIKFGKNLNLKEPKTFNEKLQWLKLYNRKDIFTIMVDKLKAKEWAASIIGSKYIIPTLAIWNKPEEVDITVLPNQFIIKPNHNSGVGITICKDKNTCNVKEIISKLQDAFKHNYYIYNREWPYKNINRKIFAEKLLIDQSGDDLKDYNFFCFNGIPKFLKVDINRFHGHRANYYNMNWELQPFGEIDYPSNPDIEVEKPANFNEMIFLAQKLSNGLPFLRVDFYSVNGKTFFGECTFFPASGTGEWYPEGIDRKLGELINLNSISASK